MKYLLFRHVQMSILFILTIFSCITTSAQIPSDLMDNCKQWKITYPTGDEEKSLCGEPNNEFFYVNAAGNAIVFNAPIRSTNGTTPNSSYIRSELRERVQDGSKDIYWTTDGTHVVYVKQAITHLPINKPHLVATQIHGNKDDGIDDSMVLRLENNHLFLSFNGGKLREDLTIKTDYTLGEIHEIIFEVIDGKHYCYYAEDGNLLNAYTNKNADSYLIKDGGTDYVMDLSYDDSYFKIGNYTQSNVDKEGDDTDNPENYGEVLVYDFLIEHGAFDVTGVTISPKTLDLIVGNSQQLDAVVDPVTASNIEVSYRTNNSSVVSVDSKGYITANSIGEALITVSTDEGGFEDTCTVNVIEAAEGSNIALKKSISGTGTHNGDHVVGNLVDGSSDSRWSVSGFPQTATIDLGAIYNIDRTEVVTYKGRDYQYIVSVSDTETGVYTQIVDRSANTTPGNDENPIVDSFSPEAGRFVKVTVTGAGTYDGEWMSVMEFRMFGESSLSIGKIKSPDDLLLWPNPAKSIVNVKSFNKFKAFEVFDSFGRLILRQNIKNEAVDVSSFKVGLYVFKFSDGLKSISKTLIKH